MSNALDDRLTELLARKQRTERQIQEVQDWLSDPASFKAIDSGVNESRTSQSQRLTGLLKVIESINEELTALPIENNYPVALGTDSIGRDVGEYTIT